MYPFILFLEVPCVQFGNILESFMLLQSNLVYASKSITYIHTSHFCFNFELCNCRMEMVELGHKILDLSHRSQLDLGKSLIPLIYRLIQWMYSSVFLYLLIFIYYTRLTWAIHLLGFTFLYFILFLLSIILCFCHWECL